MTRAYYFMYLHVQYEHSPKLGLSTARLSISTARLSISTTYRSFRVLPYYTYHTVHTVHYSLPEGRGYATRLPLRLQKNVPKLSATKAIACNGFSKTTSLRSGSVQPDYKTNVGPFPVSLVA